MTSGERVVKNVIEGLNRAFGDLEVSGYIERDKIDQTKTKMKVLVRAVERHVAPGGGVTFGNQNGFTLTIGDRVAQFSGEGRLVEQGKAPIERTEKQWREVRDQRPGAYARFCKSEITEDELFAEQPKASDSVRATEQPPMKVGVHNAK